MLVHSSFLGGGTAGLDLLIQPLLAAGVTVHAGERLIQIMPQFPPAPFPRHEYGSMDVTVELVDSMAEAIDHIHRYVQGLGFLGLGFRVMVARTCQCQGCPCVPNVRVAHAFPTWYTRATNATQIPQSTPAHTQHNSETHQSTTCKPDPG